jgi:hypothetical protein
MHPYLTTAAYLLPILPILWFYTAQISRTPTFQKIRNKRICLLIAHPDDEAMFFAPTLLALTDPAMGNHVKILCLSTGMEYTPCLSHPILSRQSTSSPNDHRAETGHNPNRQRRLARPPPQDRTPLQRPNPRPTLHLGRLRPRHARLPRQHGRLLGHGEDRLGARLRLCPLFPNLNVAIPRINHRRPHHLRLTRRLRPRQPPEPLPRRRRLPAHPDAQSRRLGLSRHAVHADVDGAGAEVRFCLRRARHDAAGGVG